MVSGSARGPRGRAQGQTWCVATDSLTLIKDSFPPLQAPLQNNRRVLYTGVCYMQNNKPPSELLQPQVLRT